jgi:CRP/FNR family transcriptional regulator
MNLISPRHDAVAIDAVPFHEKSHGVSLNVLTPEDRSRLGAIAARVRLKKGEVIYRQDAASEFLYLIAHGVVMTSREEEDVAGRVTSFAYAHDLVGLAEEGRYVETARAVTPVDLLRIPFATFESVIHQEAPLAVHILCKLCHELRERMRLSALLARGDAIGKVAMFLEALARRQRTARRLPQRLHLPMRRVDLASYLALSAEALSRAFHELARRRVVRLHSRRFLEITDGLALHGVVSNGPRRAARAASAG